MLGSRMTEPLLGTERPMNQKTVALEAVKYNPGNEHTQALLRLALFEAWNGRCHWCRLARPDATYIEIDHILPESRYAELTHGLTKEDRKAYKKKYLALVQALPTSPHDVLNLAPICAAGRRCNQEKTDAIDARTFGAIRTSLKRASSKASNVTRRVRAMVDSQGLEQHLVGMIGMPVGEETRRLVERYGQLVLSSIQKAHAPTFDVFRTPAEIALDVDLGVLPDYFSKATRTGSGVDGILYLNERERVALSSLFGIDAGRMLSDAVKDAVAEVDADVARELEVEHPELEGPRWLRISGHNLRAGQYPTFDLELEMMATFGGESIVDTNQDGDPVIVHRSVSIRSEIRCVLNFVDAEVESVSEWSVTDRE